MIKKQTKRRLFFITPFLCLFFLWINSHLLWGIRVDGNQYISNDMIQDFLQEEGIYYGMPISKIPIDKLKTSLRSKYDEITWVSIYLEGAFLKISLKERDTKNYTENVSGSMENLITDTNGIVESVLVRQGTSKVKPGDTVNKGDILIEGKIEIPAPDGTIKETKFCKAEGDVSLLYSYDIKEIISLEYVKKEYTQKKYRKYIITFQNHLWEFPFFEIPFLNYDCVTKPLEFPLSDFFSIPVNIHKTTYQEYVLVRKKYTMEQAEKIAKDKLNKIIQSLEEKGVQIIEKNVKIENSSAYLSLTGTLTLRKKLQ